ncbi:MAG: hypothetical protein HY684_03135 [Chloroflexi bacterium]|nr:hypothetical protein [Chloroflexota bacterium]
MEVQKRGVPSVAIVTTEFVSLAKSAARALGYPDLPMVVVPHPFETLPHAQVRKIAEEKLDEIVQKATKPREAPVQVQA